MGSEVDGKSWNKWLKNECRQKVGQAYVKDQAPNDQTGKIESEHTTLKYDKMFCNDTIVQYDLKILNDGQWSVA